MNDFIVDDDEVSVYDDDVVEQNQRLDEMELDHNAQHGVSKYDGMETYDENASDEQIEAFLKRQDKKANRKERRYGRFIDKTEEE